MEKAGENNLEFRGEFWIFRCAWHDLPYTAQWLYYIFMETQHPMQNLKFDDFGGRVCAAFTDSNLRQMYRTPPPPLHMASKKDMKWNCNNWIIEVK